jgi:hypothetical protein
VVGTYGVSKWQTTGTAASCTSHQKRWNVNEVHGTKDVTSWQSQVAELQETGVMWSFFKVFLVFCNSTIYDSSYKLHN